MPAAKPKTTLKTVVKKNQASYKRDPIQSAPLELRGLLYIAAYVGSKKTLFKAVGEQHAIDTFKELSEKYASYTKKERCYRLTKFPPS